MFRLLNKLRNKGAHSNYVCGSKRNLQVDRIFPGYLGGEYRLDNCQLLCKSCNARKSNKYDIFVKELYKYAGIR